MKPKDLVELLRYICSIKASDLHITSGSPPRARVNGDLVNLEYDTLLPTDTRDLCYSVMNELNRKRFEENFDVDFSFGVPELARFRANVFMQRGSVAGAFRIIPQEIPDFDILGLPPIVKEFANLPKGLVLVTGPTGSGKSTTLASLLNLINKSRSVHIITLEDPIEFTYKHDRAIVNQREIGTDASSFAQGLKHIMRQDPDVILIGEMRDAETIGAALTVAETGHLVFATLHTNSAAETITRIVDVFPASQQEQVRVQLSTSLQGIVTQSLLKKKDNSGRVVAVEILIPNSAIRNLIRENKIPQIYSTMQIGQDKTGMKIFNQSLFELYSKGLISYNEALNASLNKDELKNMMDRIKINMRG